MWEEASEMLRQSLRLAKARYRVTSEQDSIMEDVPILQEKRGDMLILCMYSIRPLSLSRLTCLKLQLQRHFATRSETLSTSFSVPRRMDPTTAKRLVWEILSDIFEITFGLKNWNINPIESM